MASIPKKSRSKKIIKVGGRNIGYVMAGVFHKEIDGTRHILQRPLAICFDLSALEDAERKGAKAAEVLDYRSGTVYQADLSLVRSAGVAIDRGYGAQIALPLSYWSIGGNPPKYSPVQEKQSQADIQPRLM